MNGAVLKNLQEEGGSGYLPALIAMLMMLAVNILFPSTLLDIHLTIAGLPVNPVLIIFLATAPFIVVYVWRHRHSLSLQPVDIALLVMAVYILVRNAFIYDDRWETGLLMAFTAYMPVLYLGGYALGMNERSLKRIFYVLSAVSFIVVAYTIVEFISNENLIFKDYIRVPVRSVSYHRSSSTLAHPLILGLYIIQMLPVTIYCYATAGKKILRWLWGLTLVLSLSALFMSYTKSSWLTMILLTAAFLFLFRRDLTTAIIARFAVIIALASLIIIGSIASSPGAVGYNLTSQERVNESFYGRWFAWNHSPKIFREKPLFGTGLRKSPDRLEELIFEEKGFTSDAEIPIDNIYLRTLMELGVIGVSICAPFFILIGRDAYKGMQRTNGPYWPGVVLAGSMSAVMVQGLFSDTLLIWVCFLIFFFEAGLVRAINNVNDSVNPD